MTEKRKRKGRTESCNGRKEWKTTSDLFFKKIYVFEKSCRIIQSDILKRRKN